ncbi:MAG: hypothetical protein E7668_05900 [Ruminococcaceae bacterium]|nr:hypothetical protein [Oscillospiraceae bacterium]
MNKYFKSGKWIWISNSSGVDEYGEFSGFFVANQAPVICRISCDGDYTLFVNGSYVESNQYGDYEHYKIFDEIDITKYVKAGSNEISVLVWHFGENSQRYINATAGVIFEFEQNEAIVLASDEKILCRQSQAYRSGYRKIITGQMGFSFLYDATKEKLGEWKPSTVVEKACTFFLRPIKKAKLLSRKEATVLKNEGIYYLVDLGEETVGLATLDLISQAEQTITVAWGEDLQNGHVRRKIGSRDFSFEYVTKQGKNEYTNYMLRLGCRYMELYAEKPITLNYLGLLPQVYPVNKSLVKTKDPRDQRIYDVCVRTLTLCMMEHYVDTPWREQCLYAFDSRNQMLCGYRAFEDGNADYARANLLLMSKDRRDDGLLSICYPCGTDLTIPSFSLYYFMAVREYLDFTGDISLIKEVYPKLISIIETFLKNRKDGLINHFAGKTHWNFYDWAKHMSGNLSQEDAAIPDLMINCLFIVALENLRSIAQKAGTPFDYEEILKETRANTHNVFYKENKAAYSLTQGGEEFTVLGNSFAILAGIAENPHALCAKIVNGEFTDCSLSMKCFQYDALLLTDKEKWNSYVLDEIRANYNTMLEAGATSVWETIEGAPAFGNAGSLCHGWSSIPICYL